MFIFLLSIQISLSNLRMIHLVPLHIPPPRRLHRGLWRRLRPPRPEDEGEEGEAEEEGGGPQDGDEGAEAGEVEADGPPERAQDLMNKLKLRQQSIARFFKKRLY